MKTVKIYMVRKPSDIDEVMELWVCLFPLDDYIFLSGKGGYDDENHRQVVELKCAGRPTLYVDPSGSSYCRYMGVEP